uniref:BED-type domain-containing protein n=1 Tax=Kalanchoe fedtschenkoi TaxID=63787 RepID=A0A7N0TQM5_KALFE
MTSDENDIPSLMTDLLSIPSDNAATSIVWNYFERLTVSDLTNARCVHCKYLLGADPMYETSHKHAHMKSCLKKKNQIIRHSFLDANNKDRVTSQAFDQQRFIEKLISIIMIYEYHLSIVNHVGFMNYLFSPWS